MPSHRLSSLRRTTLLVLALVLLRVLLPSDEKQPTRKEIAAFVG